MRAKGLIGMEIAEVYMPSALTMKSAEPQVSLKFVVAVA
jgi:hypothetical protein